MTVYIAYDSHYSIVGVFERESDAEAASRVGRGVDDTPYEIEVPYEVEAYDVQVPGPRGGWT